MGAGSDKGFFMADTLKSLGLCLGASTVSLVQVERDLEGNGAPSPHIIAHSVYSHEGDAKRCLIQALNDVELSSFTNEIHPIRVHHLSG